MTRRGRRRAVIYGIFLTVVVFVLLTTAPLDLLIIHGRYDGYGLISPVNNAQVNDVYAIIKMTIPEEDSTYEHISQTEDKNYDILINSYMRSGSSFTGQLLAFNPDTFYWYEPLWNYNSGVYYWGKNYVCTGRTICGLAKPRYSLNVERMYGTLKNIYQCNFSTLTPALADLMTPSYSGNIWTPYSQCRKRGCSKNVCLLEMEHVCKNSKHRATKVVRLTVDNLEDILDNAPNVKVIHLIRDPRAIINSRITTTWYSLQESPGDQHRAIELDAKDMCLRIMYDLKAAEVLKQKYPNRFAIVLFEDLQDDLKRKSEILYSYFGKDKTHLDATLTNMTGILAHEHTVKMMWGDYTNWWRFQLSFGAVRVIDKMCKSVSDILGYRKFDNENDLKNISISAFSFSRELLLDNLFTSKMYNFKFP